MPTRLLGYNVAVKINGKTCVGRTQDDLTITPTVKESITKECVEDVWTIELTYTLKQYADWAQPVEQNN